MSLRESAHYLTESVAALALWHSGTLRRLQERRVIRIIAYHNVSDDPDPIFGISRRVFAHQMAFLARYYRVVSLDEALGMLAGAYPWVDGAVVITFDDGYEDNHRIAWPLLRELGLPATIFLATDYVGPNAAIWLNRLYIAVRQTPLTSFSVPEVLGLREVALMLRTPAERLAAARKLVGALYSVPPQDRLVLTERLLEELRVDISRIRPTPSSLRMLTWEQIGEMAAGGLITFGSHGCSHSIASRLSDQLLRDEVSRSKAIIERQIGKPVRYFAYPNGTPGDWDRRAIGMLRELGYVAAVTMQFGVASESADVFELPRVGYNGSHRPTFAKRLEGVRLR